MLITAQRDGYFGLRAKPTLFFLSRSVDRTTGKYQTTGATAVRKSARHDKNSIVSIKKSLYLTRPRPQPNSGIRSKMALLAAKKLLRTTLSTIAEQSRRIQQEQTEVVTLVFSVTSVCTCSTFRFDRLNLPRKKVLDRRKRRTLFSKR